MLTSKQRSALRAMANDYEPIFQIGKAGITEMFVRQISDALEARELIKVTVLNNLALDTREACNILAEATGAEPVSCVGRKFIIYRRSKENQKIFLD